MYLGIYRFTRGKAKDMMVSMHPKLSKMVGEYELSDTGARLTRDETAYDYGHFDLDKCVDGVELRQLDYLTCYVRSLILILIMT